MLTVAAVIPHWNRRDLLDPLFNSLHSQTRPFDEIILADNGSDDGSGDLAASLGARVVRLDQNLGFAVAVNRGIEAAGTDWVAILNNDVTLSPNWLEILMDVANLEDAWFATGKILSAADPAIIDGTFDEISRGGCADRCGSRKPDGPVWNKSRRIRFAPMTAALFRRDLFSRVGGLDESFGSYLEDVDFGIRCATLGLGGIYLPAAVAHHRGSATWGAWNSDTVRLIARNQTLLVIKHFEGQSRWPIVAGQLLWGLVAVRHGRGVAWLRGKVAGLRSTQGIPGSGLDVAKRDRLRGIFEASERTIFELRQQTGLDWYWRAYFWLLWR